MNYLPAFSLTCICSIPFREVKFLAILTWMVVFVKQGLEKVQKVTLSTEMMTKLFTMVTPLLNFMFPNNQMILGKKPSKQLEFLLLPKLKVLQTLCFLLMIQIQERFVIQLGIIVHLLQQSFGEYTKFAQTCILEFLYNIGTPFKEGICQYGCTWNY